MTDGEGRADGALGRGTVAAGPFRAITGAETPTWPARDRLAGRARDAR